MYQAFVTRVTGAEDGVLVEVSLTAPGRRNTSLYVLEIVVEGRREAAAAHKADAQLDIVPFMSALGCSEMA
jgi:hypothetical protein